MTRFPRFDVAGGWLHVMGRALARRTLFETEQDIRKFISLLVRNVRAKRIKIHALVILLTHFHLLVESLTGEIAGVMQDVLNQYVRWFNRGRKRDGPLMRGRFESKPVDSISYRVNLVRYIDFNAVQARLANEPQAYPHGSARHHASDRGPRWLSREWIDEVLRTSPLRQGSRAELYAAIFGAPLTEEQHELVERRLRHSRPSMDPTDDLLLTGAPAVLRWMQRKSLLADGSCVGHPVCVPGAILAAIAEEEARRGPWALFHGSRNADAWTALRVGLLRDLSASTLSDIARRLDLSGSAAFRASERHAAWIASREDYALLAGELGYRAIDLCYDARRQVALLNALSG
ncbi:MAG: transposase [Planctomycetes bacterium]|nr:transposase [Planctomycetota bacterium]